MRSPAPVAETRRTKHTPSAARTKPGSAFFVASRRPLIYQAPLTAAEVPSGAPSGSGALRVRRRGASRACAPGRQRDIPNSSRQRESGRDADMAKRALLTDAVEKGHFCERRKFYRGAGALDPLRKWLPISACRRNEVKNSLVAVRLGGARGRKDIGGQPGLPMKTTDFPKRQRHVAVKRRQLLSTLTIALLAGGTLWHCLFQKFWPLPGNPHSHTNNVPL